MSRTLFFYVFKDLLRIFLLAVVALAGIMSFGGLLQPLTKQGLEASKVGQMLTYLVPAMTTYALPIAALFAATMAYGRLSADNELTACRAGGISHLSLITPAVLLGLVVSILSLLLLCFIVPRLSLGVERIIKSNIARLVANQIDRNHQFSLNQQQDTIYAQEAIVPPPDPAKPDEQVVILRGPMIVTYERSGPGTLRLPKEFWMAKQATAYITNWPREARVSVVAVLEDGTKFPRNFAGATQFGIGVTQYGPQVYDSPVREHPKFKDVRELKSLLSDAGSSRQIRGMLSDLNRQAQSSALRKQVLQQLNTAGSYTFASGMETYILRRGAGPAQISGDKLIIPSAGADPSGLARLESYRGSALEWTGQCGQIEVRFTANTAAQQMRVDAEMLDMLLVTPEGSVAHSAFARGFNLPMPAELATMENRTAESYLADPAIPSAQQQALRRALVRLGNFVQSEMHARSSFAVSCLILVIVGAALGMMFKSGNFLSAFAVSVVPALICIALIVTGQHTVENIPDIVTSANNPLRLGIAVIWSGNLLVMLLGAGLIWRLQRQ